MGQEENKGHMAQKWSSLLPHLTFLLVHTCLSLHLLLKCFLNISEQKYLWHSEPHIFHPTTSSSLSLLQISIRFMQECHLFSWPYSMGGGSHSYTMVTQLIDSSFLQFMHPFLVARTLVISLQGHDFALWIIKFHAVSFCCSTRSSDFSCIIIRSSSGLF